MKFTFKKEKARPFSRFKTTSIKLEKKEVGCINISDDSCKVFFAIKRIPTKEDPTDFCWVRLKYTGKNEKKTREWLNEKIEILIAKYNLHRFED